MMKQPGSNKLRAAGIKLFFFFAISFSLCILPAVSFAATPAPAAPGKAEPSGKAKAGAPQPSPAAPPKIEVRPGSHDFQAVAVGTRSNVTFNIVNTGGSELVVKSLDISAENPSQFQIANETCEGISPKIGAGKSCSIIVTFIPAAAGKMTAKLLITSNSVVSPTLEVPLTAMAGPPSEMKKPAAVPKQVPAGATPAPQMKPAPAGAVPPMPPAGTPSPQMKPAVPAERQIPAEGKTVAPPAPKGGVQTPPASMTGVPQTKPAVPAQKPAVVETTAAPRNLTVELHADKTSPVILAVVGSVKFTAQASGGSGKYEYKFWLKDLTTGGGWKVAQDYSPLGTYSWIPAQTGSYEIWVYAKEEGGSAPEASAWMPFAVVEKSPATIVTVTADKTSPAMKSEVGTVIFTPYASGGSGRYEYQFWIEGPSTGNEWKVAQDYGISDSFAWTPTNAGHYIIWVYARNIGSPAPVEAATWTSFNVLERPPVSSAQISADRSGSIPASSGMVTFTAGASGGSGTYEYEFWLAGPSTRNEWQMVQGYNASDTFSWAPQQPGAYLIAVYARNAGSRVSYEAVAGMKLNVTEK